jgi:hypothetical protein
MTDGRYQQNERGDAKDDGPETGRRERRRESFMDVTVAHVQIVISLLESAI